LRSVRDCDRGLRPREGRHGFRDAEFAAVRDSEFSTDSLLEGDGFELFVPLGISASPSWWSRARKPHGAAEGSFSVAGPIVRIHLPPAESRANFTAIPVGTARSQAVRAWRKVEEGMAGFVNVKTDYRARAKVRGPPPGRSLTRRRAEMPTVVGSNKSRSAQEPTAMRPRSGMP